MKINQLPYGAHFEYEGEEYIKTGPMFGTGPHGPRVIPRSAILKPIPEATAVPCAVEKVLTRNDVLRAFDAFYTDCRTLVAEDQNDSLALLRDRFLRSLDGVR